MKKQQKFGKRKTYTPTNASQVCSSVACSLNREDTLGETGLKTSPNSLYENQHQRIDGLNAKVFVLNRKVDKKAVEMPIHLLPKHKILGRSILGKSEEKKGEKKRR